MPRTVWLVRAAAAATALLISLALLAGCSNNDTTATSAQVSSAPVGVTAPPGSKSLISPHLVGLSHSAANAKLARLGVRPQYAHLGDDCVDTPASGPISKQSPRPGQIMRNDRVLLEVACMKGEAVPDCQRSEVGLYVKGDEPEYTGGGEAAIAYARIKNRGAGPCRLNAVVTLTIFSENGDLAPIPNNPTSVTVSNRLGLGELLAGAWIWRSWCGNPQKFTFSVTTDGREKRGRLPTTPACVGKTMGIIPGTGLGELRPGQTNPFLPDYVRGEYRRALDRLSDQASGSGS